MTSQCRFKLIAADIDGTLLDDDKNFPERNREALLRAAEMGVTIVLASGRMTSCISPWYDLLGIDGPIIAYNGARVVGPAAEGRKALFHQPLQAEYADAVIEFHESSGVHLNYYLDDKLYAKDNDDMRQWVEVYSQRTGAEVNYVDSLREFRGNEPTKLILISAPDRRNELYDQFLERFGSDVSLTKTDPEYLEFLDSATSKATGLKALCASLGISLDEVIAFGDGDNDAPMLAVAGLGVAMPGSSEAALSAAGHVTQDDNNSGGVAEAVERFIFSGPPSR